MSDCGHLPNFRSCHSRTAVDTETDKIIAFINEKAIEVERIESRLPERDKPDVSLFKHRCAALGDSIRAGLHRA